MVYRLKWRSDGTYLYKATFGLGRSNDISVKWSTRGVAFNTTDRVAAHCLARLWDRSDVVVTRGRK